MIPDRIRQHDWNNLDWHYIQGLSKAVEAVREEYIYEKKERYHIERVFAYELYYNWKTILSEESENPEKLLLNGELTKHYYNEKYGFPDMVLHGDYTKNDKQFIICEIKSSRNSIEYDKLIKDLKSLAFGIKELHYHCGVFVYLGVDIDPMLDKLRCILQSKELRQIVENKILFIGIDGKTPHYELL
ncbi:MAG: hypothetical protein J1E57_01880 [Prevotella sp.]|nr:hypothetical protein [Prevotella sp.]